MAVSYKRLWKLLIDRDMKKKDLREMVGISPSTIAKLGRNENINVFVLDKICNVLNCRIEDIVEVHIDSFDEANKCKTKIIGNGDKKIDE
jgi:putative transcriptional regulator